MSQLQKIHKYKGYEIEKDFAQYNGYYISKPGDYRSEGPYASVEEAKDAIDDGGAKRRFETEWGCKW